MTDIKTVEQHQRRLRRCRRCPDMQGPPVTGEPVVSPVMLIGQAPGNREIELHRPFAWTAGKTLFGWFARIGLEEEDFRQRVYMAAVCRCFPGKLDKGGDRVPSREEIANCRSWWQQEIALLQPQLLIPVGKLAIAQFMPVNKLNDVIGQRHRIEIEGKQRDIIPLPHPSGASTWHRTEPGITLLNKALQAIKRHSAWKKISAEC
ncbi:MAG: uracil-DNA glycosylase family protein [Thiohalophilus sp.]|uniref:uracil-DNA glycosylase family protein n=1 Tax=Thiohalophilus sp. TaxID=3028392 RepID=UPI002870A29D|nr:uracil-DNA glycosylase family protein [Thiohalophilus sp.]MDR9436171.1 uracil-DNA glycosylase family protein [Thiohalophilus sp.]